MAKFTKYNNPNRRRTHRKSPYSSAYIAERRNELNGLLANANSDAERDILEKAYAISIGI